MVAFQFTFVVAIPVPGSRQDHSDPGFRDDLGQACAVAATMIAYAQIDVVRVSQVMPRVVIRSLKVEEVDHPNPSPRSLSDTKPGLPITR
jgi:hypothetical protein